MPSIRCLTLFVFLTTFTACVQEAPMPTTPPATTISLDAWTDASTKQAIVEFVQAVTDTAHADYVPPARRVAVFDLDGTVVCEKPNYSEVAFSIYHLQQQAALDSTLLEQPVYRAAVEGDSTYLSDSVDQVLTTPFVGYSQQQYMDSVWRFFETVQHPSLERPYAQLFYQPMVELIQYLQQHDFQVYLSSYTQQTFIRSLATHFLEIPQERAIGSIVDVDFQTVDQQAAFLRQDDFILKNSLKAEVFDYQIGAAPILVAGNSGGDLELLNYASLAPKHLVLVVNHDDANREFEYGDADFLQTVTNKGWTIISMQHDFKTIFGALSSQ